MGIGRGSLPRTLGWQHEQPSLSTTLQPVPLLGLHRSGEARRDPREEAHCHRGLLVGALGTRGLSCHGSGYPRLFYVSLTRHHIVMSRTGVENGAFPDESRETSHTAVPTSIECFTRLNSNSPIELVNKDRAEGLFAVFRSCLLNLHNQLVTETGMGR